MVGLYQLRNQLINTSGGGNVTVSSDFDSGMEMPVEIGAAVARILTALPREGIHVSGLHQLVDEDEGLLMDAECVRRLIEVELVPRRLVEKQGIGVYQRTPIANNADYTFIPYISMEREAA